MKLINYSLATLSLVISASATSSPPCGSPTYRADIERQVNWGIGNVTAVQQAIGATCPPFGQFVCADADMEAIFDALNAAFTAFVTAFYLYDEIIQSGAPQFCGGLTPVCDCENINGRITEILSTYNTDYAEKWQDFIGTDPGDCVALAEQLQKLVDSYACFCREIDLNLGQCLENCKRRCLSPENQTIIASTTENINLAINALRTVEGALGDQCQRNTFVCAARVMESVIAALGQAEAAFTDVLDAYNAILKPRNYTLICPSNQARCDCAEDEKIVSSIIRSCNTEYLELFDSIVLGTAPVCLEALIAIRDLVGGYNCSTRALKENYSVCMERCQECDVLVCDAFNGAASDGCCRHQARRSRGQMI